MELAPPAQQPNITPNTSPALLDPGGGDPNAVNSGPQANPATDTPDYPTSYEINQEFASRVEKAMGALPFRTAVSYRNELKLLEHMAAMSDLAEREAWLISVAAKPGRNLGYEQVDASIYASQVRLLEILNAVGQLGRDKVKTDFYNPAVKTWPAAFAKGDFDQYLTFLVGHELVTDVNGIVAISDSGREYLIWRVEVKKLPKALG